MATPREGIKEVMVYMPKELWKRLHIAIAEEKIKSMSQACITGVEAYLNRLDKRKKRKKRVTKK